VILVDTSVWVSAFRSADSDSARTLRRLLDEKQVALAIPVRIELLVGLSRRGQHSMGRALSALPLLYPSPATWESIERWVEDAAGAGERFGFADLLIAAIASENDLPVWSLDTDFSRMAALGWLKIFAIETRR
jgi:predicted nucleic acid-binding protein